MKKVLLSVGIFCFAFFSAQKDQNYLEVGYASICCGPPSEDAVINYVTQFQKKNKIKAIEVYQVSGLGREGEFNLYIGIDKLTKVQRNKLIKGLQSTINSQNSQRNENRDGIVNFDGAMLVKKSDLSQKRNMTLYKKSKF